MAVTLQIVGGAFLIGLAVAVGFTRSRARARHRVAGRSELLRTSAGTLEYAVVGEGPRVLVVHGAPGGFDQALDMVGPLAGSGFQLVAPSRFGYLRSQPQALTVTPEMQADAYIELFDHLAIDSAAVVAISAGAWSALEFASRHPSRCRALVLVVPADHLPPGVSVHGGRFTDWMLRSDFLAWLALRVMALSPASRLTEMMLGTPASVIREAHPAERSRVGEILEHLLPLSDRRAGMRDDIRVAADRREPAFDTIGCPVLTISAEDDRFGTANRARAIAGAVRDGRVVVYPTGGHALVGRLSSVLEEGRAFLAQHG